jgi:ligand-binding sensor domain-containing protein
MSFKKTFIFSAILFLGVLHSAFCINPLSQELPGNSIINLAVDGKGVVWIYCHNNIDGYRLLSYDGTSWTNHPVTIPSNPVVFMRFDTSDVLWMVLNDEPDRLLCYDGAQFSTFTIPFDWDDPDIFYPLGVVAVRDSSIWLSSYQQGIKHFNGEDWILYTTADSLASNTANDIEIDSTGVVWVATYNGLSRFDGVHWYTFNSENSPLNNAIRSLFIDSSGHIWVGSYNVSDLFNMTNIQTYDGTDWITFSHRYLDDDVNGMVYVYAITEDASGTIWFGHSYGAGMIANGRTYDLKQDNICDFPKERIISMEADKSDNIWFLSDEGLLYRLDTSLISAVEEPAETPSAFETTCHPNPFNPMTTISYTIPERADVSISIYTATGQKIRSADIGMQQPGSHEYVFNGSGLPSGVYLYRLKAGRDVRSGRMLLMK